MGLLTLIQIPCHHVLSNKIALNLKYRIDLKHFFNINLRIGIIKKLPFCLYFRHISLCFYSNFNQDSSLDVELNSTSNEYPLGIHFTSPTTPPKKIPQKMWWWCHHHFFLGISYFWGRGAHKTYDVWVLVGCEI